MAEPLPATNRCGFCGEWWAQAHVCPSKADYIIRPAGIKIEAKPEPDCRTCQHSVLDRYDEMHCHAFRLTGSCLDGDLYKPLPPVKLWRK